MTVKDTQVVQVHPSSVLDHRPDFVLYHDFVLTKRNYIRTCLGIKGEWLFEVAKNYFNPRNIKHLETRRELERIEKEIILQKARENKKKAD